jgi:membrane-anchored protein YejM (alkaline phosphatase superfamily)
VITDAALWCAMVALLLMFRGLLVWLFRAEMSADSDFNQVARCFATGLRYDILIASYAIVPTLTLTLISFFRPLGIWHDRVRQTLAVVVAAVSMLTFVVDIGYFQEYHDQFNHWIFGLIFDDRDAITKTVWKGYPVVWLAVLVVALTVGLVWAGRRVWRLLSADRAAAFSSGAGRWLTARSDRPAVWGYARPWVCVRSR